jgi:hypothetical protein
MKTQEGDELVYYIPEYSIQETAKILVGRELSDEEIYSVKKGIEAGLEWDIDSVIEHSIKNAVLQFKHEEE